MASPLGLGKRDGTCHLSLAGWLNARSRIPGTDVRGNGLLTDETTSSGAKCVWDNVILHGWYALDRTRSPLTWSLKNISTAIWELL
jgi:hypothetical protein